MKGKLEFSGKVVIRRLMMYALPLTMAFAGVIVAIRAHPYDDHDLRAFLMAENCAPPCWQAIRPGRMTVDKALTILRSHPWIGRIDTSLYDGFRGWIRWEWSGREPDWIRPSEDDYLWIDQNLVVNISLATGIRFGDIWLALGAPDWTNTYQARQTGLMRVFNGYREGTLLVILELQCSRGLGQLWFTPTELIWPMFLQERGEIMNALPAALSSCEH